MKKELEGKYAIATVISSFRQRYVIPTEALQEMNEKIDLDETHAKQWLEESVGCEEVKEFSQKFLGEQVIDIEVVDEKKILDTFDKDNDYLVDWSTEKKIEFIRKWEDKKEMP
jgi:hypothetical protein